jgi:NADPH:quinone reductase-like Zn-dependent oxidoreductase
VFVRALGVFGTLQPSHARGGDVVPLTVDGMLVRATMMTLREDPPDLTSPQYARSVLVRVQAFSCNYRDKGCFRTMQQVSSRRFRVIGSEFSGTVVAVGVGVASIAVGDRVIGQNAYAAPGATREESRADVGGLPTNGASREYLVLREHAVARIPECMPFVTGAAFGVNAQTAFSMLRRSGIRAGQSALVTSAGSNTSLALIYSLLRHGVRVTASTSSPSIHPALLALGVERVLSTHALRASACDAGAHLPFGPIEVVFDPFFDLHLDAGVRSLVHGGRYITCGVAAQNAHVAAQLAGQSADLAAVMRRVILYNISVIGNCLGTAADLDAALAAFADGSLTTPIDSVHTGENSHAFLSRTFLDTSRFGKVVFAYD